LMAGRRGPMTASCAGQGGRSHPRQPIVTIGNNPSKGLPGGDPGERRTWRGWMADPAIWELLQPCRPWPNPHRLAIAYRQRFGRFAGGDSRRPTVYAYSRAEVVELARWLQEQQAAARPVYPTGGQGR
jgi:hypothetical protein